MEIRESARKHGITDDAIRHAIDHYAYTADVDEGEPPHRALYLGPDSAGNLIEVVTVGTGDGSEVVIHAMRMRDRYNDAIPGQGGRR